MVYWLQKRMDEEKKPLYNLKAVVRETGVPAPTLAHLGAPLRAPLPSAYILRPSPLLLPGCGDGALAGPALSEGMTIGQAVALWRELEADGQDPLCVPLLSRPEPFPAAVGLSRLRQAWVDAVLAFRESAADNVLNQAFAFYPPETVCQEILLRGLREIGNLWYAGKATVAQEHFASGLAVRRMESLIHAAPPPTGPAGFWSSRRRWSAILSTSGF